jgi:hypothetical protein
VGGVSVSILIVDDEPDVAELFRQRFRRETRQGLSCYNSHPLARKRFGCLLKVFGQ